MKKTKIVIPALGLLLLSTAASVTGTVAWFSANTSVKVTGMAVTTKVSGNLLIADSQYNNANDTYYRAADLNQGQTGILEPVSTIDGINYFFTKDDISGAGAAASTSVFKSYATEIAASATDASYDNAFEEYYKVAGALGYVDYTFYLKATSAAAGEKVVINKCNISYGTNLSGSSEISDKAWRVAVFAKAVDEGVAGSAAVVGDNISILALSDAAYFTATNQAVKTIDGSGAATKATVSNYNPAGGTTIGTLAAAGDTQRYFVTVRLWLEGEDTTCTNETYAELTNKYHLSLECGLVASSVNGVTALGSEDVA